MEEQNLDLSDPLVLEKLLREQYLDGNNEPVNVIEDDSSDDIDNFFESNADNEEEIKEDDNKDGGAAEDEENDNNTNEYNILDIIREEGLLYIPDDFEGDLDEEALELFKEQTFLLRDEQIVQSRRNKFANDQYKLELFDYFMTAEEDADIPKYTQILDNIKSYENFDVSNEDNIKLILSDYLKEGLDPTNPAHALRLSKVGSEVDDIINSGKGEDIANEAKSYFINKNINKKKEEDRRIANIKDLEKKQEQLDRERQKLWNDAFQQAIVSKSWQDTKKQKVISEQYNLIELDQNTTVPLWYAKELMIKSDPGLYITYLEWLTENFDINTRKFKNQQEEDLDTKATRKILDIANKKSSGKKSTIQVKTNNKNVIVDPLKYS